MLEPLAVPVLNRLLRANTWALDRLRVHAGKTALLECPPFALRLTVLASGELTPAPPDTAADVNLRATPPLLLRLAARDESAWNEAQVTGDVELASTIDYVRRNLKWDVEETMSRVFGDVAAHRLTEAARRFERWGRETALDLGRAAAEYSTYEGRLLASPPAVDEFIREVDEVRDQVERLEKRLQLLNKDPERGNAPP